MDTNYLVVTSDDAGEIIYEGEELPKAVAHAIGQGRPVDFLTTLSPTAIRIGGLRPLDTASQGRVFQLVDPMDWHLRQEIRDLLEGQGR